MGVANISGSNTKKKNFLSPAQLILNPDGKVFDGHLILQ